MKLLITGAAGFIGYHLINKLANEFAIVGADNINSYYDPGLKLGRLKELGIKTDKLKEGIAITGEKFPDFSFIKMDISDKEMLSQIFEKEEFDMVINLAAQAGVRYSIDNPDTYIQSNMIGFYNIIETCRQFGVKNLIFASSSSVYGNTRDVPFHEDQFVDNPISLYAATKKSNELVAHVYSHLYGINTIGIRFFTVYGAWGRPDMAYFKFINKIMNDEPIEVYNHGNLERDFTYIDDIITGIEKIIKMPVKHSYQIYNIGNSKPVNLLRFIEIIEHELGKKAKKIMKDMQPGDVYTTYADTSKLEKDYEYHPSTDLTTGIRNFVKWYKEYYKV